VVSLLFLANGFVRFIHKLECMDSDIYTTEHVIYFPLSYMLRFGRYIWTEIYPLDHFASGAGPGRRWKFSVVTDGISMAIFGGQTLWEGSVLVRQVSFFPSFRATRELFLLFFIRY
jgi:hypothetical protein